MIKEIEVDGVRHSIQAENTIKTTWAELKALRDEAKLNAGTFYRITDYVTTTTQSETKSANHPFDVIVLALSENTLSEDAKAALHEGDTYFADSDLSAWELKYCLDNDKTRFAWADGTNGKGVIYRMVDEKRNDCPYDFKNILFYNTKLTSITTNDKYYYTFSYVRGSALYDGTTEKQAFACYGNVMSEYRNTGVLQLNNNVFRNTSFGNNCYSNTFGNNCHSNTFGDYCYCNTFGDYCYYNTFGDYCYYNTLGNYCSSNTFGDNCSYNTFGDNCRSNTFGDNCSYNTFGDNCRYNTFGDILQNRHLYSDKTSITLNEEYFDDGSAQLVPTKHPDLSTQPSILPYKFMGQYVYERILPLSFNSSYQKWGFYFYELPFESSQNVMFIEADVLGVGGKIVNVPVTINYTNASGKFVPVVSKEVSDALSDIPEEMKYYIRIVYTSMPEEEGGYYGYNNY